MITSFIDTVLISIYIFKDSVFVRCEGLADALLGDLWLVTYKAVVARNHRVITQHKNGIFLSFNHLIWPFKHFLEDQNVVIIVCVAAVWGLLTGMVELVSVVDCASAMASITFVLGANIRVSSIKEEVKSFSLIRIRWQVLLNNLKLLFDFLVPHLIIFLANLNLRGILLTTLN